MSDIDRTGEGDFCRKEPRLELLKYKTAIQNLISDFELLGAYIRRRPFPGDPPDYTGVVRRYRKKRHRQVRFI